jgi:hypothetical protein
MWHTASLRWPRGTNYLWRLHGSQGGGPLATDIHTRIGLFVFLFALAMIKRGEIKSRMLRAGLMKLHVRRWIGKVCLFQKRKCQAVCNIMLEAGREARIVYF